MPGYLVTITYTALKQGYITVEADSKSDAVNMVKSGKVTLEGVEFEEINDSDSHYEASEVKPC